MSNGQIDQFQIQKPSCYVLVDQYGYQQFKNQFIVQCFNKLLIGIYNVREYYINQLLHQQLQFQLSPTFQQSWPSALKIQFLNIQKNTQIQQSVQQVQQQTRKYLPQIIFLTSNKQLANATKQKLLNTYECNQNENCVKIIDVYGVYYIICYYNIKLQTNLPTIQLNRYNQQQKIQILQQQTNNIEQFYLQDIQQQQTQIIYPPNVIIPSIIIKYKSIHDQTFKQLLLNLYQVEKVYLASTYYQSQNDEIYCGIYYNIIANEQQINNETETQKQYQTKFKRFIIQQLTQNYTQVIIQQNYKIYVPYDILLNLSVSKEEIYNFDQDCYKYLQFQAKLFISNIYKNYRFNRRITQIPHYLVFCDSEFIVNTQIYLLPYEISFLIYDTQKGQTKTITIYPKLSKQILTSANLKSVNNEYFWQLQQTQGRDQEYIQNQIKEIFRNLDQFILLLKGKEAECKYFRQIGQIYLMDHSMEEEKFLYLLTGTEQNIDIQTKQIHNQSVDKRCSLHQQVEAQQNHCSAQDVWNEAVVFYQMIMKYINEETYK